MKRDYDFGALVHGDMRFITGKIEKMNTEEEVNKLLPCPFCGGEAIINQNLRNGYEVKCTKCKVGISQKVVHKSLEWLKAKMIEDWNKRQQSQSADVAEKKGGYIYQILKGDTWVITNLENYISHEGRRKKSVLIEVGDKDEEIKSDWISVEIQMPEDGQRCFVFNSISVEPSVYNKGEFYRYPNEINGDRCALYHFDKSKVTHWQPIPTPPSKP